MTIKRIVAIALIYVIAWAGWWTLGTITSFRSHKYSSSLTPMVYNLWGTPLQQDAPKFFVKIPGTDIKNSLIPAKNTINVKIDPDYRKKGLIWYSTYNCEFSGTYTIKNIDKTSQKIYVHFDFPSQNATYDEFSISLNDKLLNLPVDTKTGVDEIIELDTGKKAKFTFHYKTRGINNFRYLPSKDTGRVRDFTLKANTSFKNVDFTNDSLSPDLKNETDKGMELIWKYSDSITKNSIGLIIPEKLNPGPLTTRITFFAPVCLFFFIILIAAINIVYEIKIHPMHYFFTACGFFAFHLLLSYFAGHIKIHLAFIISGVTSISLVTGYLYAALGKNFPWKIAASGQIFFLILFSYSFFIKGITGITIAIGSVVTLAILMKVTAKVDWEKVFEKKEKLPSLDFD